MNYKRLFIQNGLIFLTIVTKNRIPILIENIELMKYALQNVTQYYNFDLIAYSVLPDHIHCIIKPSNIEEYPKIIKSFKYSFTKNFKLRRSDLPIRQITEKLWQNRYWEHTIRDEEDLNKHLDYIHYNPMKHKQITPKDWKYSSFNKFVEQGFYDKNWCNFDDKNNIINMDLE